MAKKHVLPSYTFGVEIECFSEKVHPAVIAHTLTQAGFKINDLVTEHIDNENGYGDDYEDSEEDDSYGCAEPSSIAPERSGYDTETWTFGHDGSIEGTNPIEIKSPILRGEKGLKDIRRFTHYINKLGVKVNQSCGLHVHVGIANADRKFENDEIVAILKRYLAHQEQIDKFLARSRRGKANQYCQPIDTLVQNLESVVVPTYGPEAPPRNWTSLNSAQKDYWIRYGQGSFFWNSDRRYHETPEPIDGDNHLVRIAQIGDHYDRVSVQPLSKYGTIEFRQHHGTVNGKKITNWIRFLLNHVEMARVLTEKRKRAKEPEKVTDHLFSGLPTRVRKHFMEQAKRLEAPRQQG